MSTEDPGCSWLGGPGLLGSSEGDSGTVLLVEHGGLPLHRGPLVHTSHLEDLGLRAPGDVHLDLGLRLRFGVFLTASVWYGGFVLVGVAAKMALYSFRRHYSPV